MVVPMSYLLWLWLLLTNVRFDGNTSSWTTYPGTRFELSRRYAKTFDASSRARRFGETRLVIMMGLNMKERKWTG
ncbi:hypothetical protein GGR53DRAFT_502849 [Hypoxylon sp. FL1150]|nr:hypothetical protein GGR53DRAFT_502849 [Hypoxylon sp. FL1150]